MSPDLVDKAMAQAQEVYGPEATLTEQQTLREVEAYLREESDVEACMVAYRLGGTFKPFDADRLEAQTCLMALINLEQERRHPGTHSAQAIRNFRSKVFPTLWDHLLAT